MKRYKITIESLSLPDELLDDFDMMTIEASNCSSAVHKALSKAERLLKQEKVRDKVGRSFTIEVERVE